MWIVLGLHGSRRPLRGLLTMRVCYSDILFPHPSLNAIAFRREERPLGRVSKDGCKLHVMTARVEPARFRR